LQLTSMANSRSEKRGEPNATLNNAHVAGPIAN
jgi:hypothetical protein